MAADVRRQPVLLSLFKLYDGDMYHHPVWIPGRILLYPFVSLAGGASDVVVAWTHTRRAPEALLGNCGGNLRA